MYLIKYLINPSAPAALLPLHARGPRLPHGGRLHAGRSRGDGQVHVGFRSRALREIPMRAQRSYKGTVHDAA